MGTNRGLLSRGPRVLSKINAIEADFMHATSCGIRWVKAKESCTESMRSISTTLKLDIDERYDIVAIL